MLPCILLALRQSQEQLHAALAPLVDMQQTVASPHMCTGCNGPENILTPQDNMEASQRMHTDTALQSRST